MYRLSSVLSAIVLIWSLFGHLLSAAEPSGPNDEPAELAWHSSYAEAVEVAMREGKMMLICFDQPGGSKLCDQFAREALCDPGVVERLEDFVRLKVPIDTTIEVEQGQIVLLEHRAFQEMLGRPGVAIIDYAHTDAPYYGCVVSTFPFLNGRPYSPREMAAILDLPPGTLTQRTLIYAVRTHPDRPASTQGRLAPFLAEEAQRHSEHQARIRRQGHHNWQRRFHQIKAKLSEGLLPVEVCAESWPGENLVEAAIECVRCWRLSSGHWKAVRTRHPVYGYDMKRGSDGVWYATGIFGRKPARYVAAGASPDPS